MNPTIGRIKVRKAYCLLCQNLGEWLWADQVSADTAIIDSIPQMTVAFCKGDLVRISQNLDIVKVLKRGDRTAHVLYLHDPGSPKKKLKRLRSVVSHLEGRGIGVEPCVPGFVAIAVPKGMDDEQLDQILSQCRVKLVRMQFTPCKCGL